MSLILTFLGKGGVGRSTMAIAIAQKLASQGQRVLLASQDAGPAFGMRLGTALTCDPTTIASNLDVLQFQATVLLERSWDEVKRLEAEYLKDPFFKSVYGQELGILPGMDGALALNAVREYDASGSYDVIIYDGPGDQETLRLFGMPDILGWYLRRFRTVFTESDFVKTITPFAQPVASAVLNVDWGGDWFAKPTGDADNMLEQGKAAVTSASRVAAYLVTTSSPDAIATAQYLWGGAQQIGLTVGGLLVNHAQSPVEVSGFEPLPTFMVPHCSDMTGAESDNVLPIAEALPDLSIVARVPKSLEIDVSNRTVRLFLPSFDKKQVKLTQYGPEVTIEAGDQRRNILLPNELRGQPVTGAKFQDSYLIISF